MRELQENKALIKPVLPSGATADVGNEEENGRSNTVSDVERWMARGRVDVDDFLAGRHVRGLGVCCDVVVDPPNG